MIQTEILQALNNRIDDQLNHPDPISIHPFEQVKVIKPEPELITPRHSRKHNGYTPPSTGKELVNLVVKEMQKRHPEVPKQSWTKINKMVFVNGGYKFDGKKFSRYIDVSADFLRLQAFTEADILKFANATWKNRVKAYLGPELPEPEEIPTSRVLEDVTDDECATIITQYMADHLNLSFTTSDIAKYLGGDQSQVNRVMYQLNEYGSEICEARTEKGKWQRYKYCPEKKAITNHASRVDAYAKYIYHTVRDNDGIGYRAIINAVANYFDTSDTRLIKRVLKGMVDAGAILKEKPRADETMFSAAEQTQDIIRRWLAAKAGI